MCCLPLAVSEKAGGVFAVGWGGVPLPPSATSSTNYETTHGERPCATCNGEICDCTMYVGSQLSGARALIMLTHVANTLAENSKTPYQNVFIKTCVDILFGWGTRRIWMGLLLNFNRIEALPPCDEHGQNAKTVTYQTKHRTGNVRVCAFLFGKSSPTPHLGPASTKTVLFGQT